MSVEMTSQKLTVQNPRILFRLQPKIILGHVIEKYLKWMYTFASRKRCHFPAQRQRIFYGVHKYIDFYFLTLLPFLKLNLKWKLVFIPKHTNSNLLIISLLFWKLCIIIYTVFCIYCTSEIINITFKFKSQDFIEDKKILKNAHKHLDQFYCLM